MNMAVTSQQGAVTPAGDRLPAVAQFGNRANALRVITIPLDTVMTDKLFNLTGTVLYAISATSLNATMDVALQEQGNGALPISQGFMIRGVRFDKIYITASAQAGESITLLVAVEQNDKLEIVNPANQFTSVTVSKAANITSFADVVIAAGGHTDIAADATRRELHITSLAANTTNCRVGGSTSDATHGAELLPGGSVVIGDTPAGASGAVRIFNPSAAAITISGFTVND